MIINCPCCHSNINEIGSVILDNIKCPLDKTCIFCLCELNSVDNTVNDKLVSCPKCGNLFHSDCWVEYVNYTNDSSETPVINTLPTTNVYNTNRFINPNLLPVRTVSEINDILVVVL